MFGVIKRIDDKLYQWDTGRKLFIDNTEGLHFDEVHFANKNSKTALVVVPYIDEENDGKLVVDIPNILLQESEILHVYLVESDMGEERTIYHTSFSVMRRNKPDDYIYTETEILNYINLDKRITELNEKLNTFTSDALVYCIDYENPNWEEAYAAYESGAMLFLTNCPGSNKYPIPKKACIPFTSYYAGGTFGSVTIAPYFNFAGTFFSAGSDAGYIEISVIVNSYGERTISSQPLRNYLNTEIGGTMKAPLILTADPVKDLEAATKKYVDNKNKELDSSTKEALNNINNELTDIKDDLNEKPNVLTYEETLKLLAETDIIELATDENGDIPTDVNGNVFVF